MPQQIIVNCRYWTSYVEMSLPLDPKLLRRIIIKIKKECHPDRFYEAAYCLPTVYFTFYCLSQSFLFSVFKSALKYKNIKYIYQYMFKCFVFLINSNWQPKTVITDMQCRYLREIKRLLFRNDKKGIKKKLKSLFWLRTLGIGN